MLGSGLDDSECSSQFFPFENVVCSRDDEVSLGIGSCHLTEISVFANVVRHSKECEFQ